MNQYNYVQHKNRRKIQNLCFSFEGIINFVTNQDSLSISAVNSIKKKKIFFATFSEENSSLYIPSIDIFPFPS